ncbi:MAG: DUF1080 domain-containing protein [Planctomycetes bacterium]|nr:DUF1080 domain-containing protein [Planctomycetota bacterium]
MATKPSKAASHPLPQERAEVAKGEHSNLLRQRRFPGVEVVNRFVVAVTLIALTCGAGLAAADGEARSAESAGGWMSLFDGKSLRGWSITKFGGEGKVEVEDGRIVLGFGNDLTGIHTTRKLPTIEYEVELEAMRVDGTDFFCGLTFPVGEAPCSLILGGWGGGVCGLSSIDGLDASENETTTYREFKNGRWYRVRLRVTSRRIQAWLDGKEIVDQDIADRRISIRYEVEPSKPFGIASWQTTAALKNIRLRPLGEDDPVEAPQPSPY